MAKILKYKGNPKRKSLNIRASLHKVLARLAVDSDRAMEDLANEAIAQYLISEDTNPSR